MFQHLSEFTQHMHSSTLAAESKTEDSECDESRAGWGNAWYQSSVCGGIISKYWAQFCRHEAIEQNG